MHNNHSIDRDSQPPRVPDGVRVYAIGDVHGRDDLLWTLLGRIRDDLQAAPIGRCQVVFLGDYIDRGPDSRHVIERLLDGPGEWCGNVAADWICLRGNHEEQAMRFLHDSNAGFGWLHNGGMETLRSYIGGVCHDMDDDLTALQLLFERSLPPTHLRFLARLPLWYVVGDYFFVHAGIRPGVELHQQSPHDLLWIRRDFFNEEAWHGKFIVHGHTIHETPDEHWNRAGIDTGAYYTHHLTCLVLEGEKRRFLAT